jgi:hypothetical protein
MTWYYDCAPTVDDATSEIQVDRMYCFDLERFSQTEWDALGHTYKQLPGWRPSKDGYPMWYGNHIDKSPVLWASIEPPGIQIAGSLQLSDWQEWDAQFQVLTAKLPRRSLD